MMQSAQTYEKSSSDVIHSFGEYSTTYLSITNKELKGTALDNYVVDSSTTAIHLNSNTVNTEAETTEDMTMDMR